MTQTRPHDDQSPDVAAAGACPAATGYRPDFTYPTNDEKRRLLELRQKGRAPRVLCGWGGNSRVVVLDPALNPEGFTYEGMLNDPTVPPIVQSRFDEYWNTTIAETRRILESGVKEGRKFGLREGNNLPPCVPLENLRAVYQACIEYGG